MRGKTRSRQPMGSRRKVRPVALRGYTVRRCNEHRVCVAANPAASRRKGPGPCDPVKERKEVSAE